MLPSALESTFVSRLVLAVLAFVFVSPLCDRGINLHSCVLQLIRQCKASISTWFAWLAVGRYGTLLHVKAPLVFHIICSVVGHRKAVDNRAVN